ncbi:Uncharacterised protein [Vibrio cholerae]|nr:Uncharacterised protein [Vibrio cholerae]
MRLSRDSISFHCLSHLGGSLITAFNHDDAVLLFSVASIQARKYCA